MAGSIVQVVAVTVGIPGGGSIAGSITPTAGNHVVAWSGGLLGTTATLTLSDNIGDRTWNNGFTTNPANAIRKSAYIENVTAGARTITATFGSSNWIDRSLVLIEIAGLQTSSSLDQATGQHQTGATGANSITSGNPSATTTANCFVVGLTACYNGSQSGSAGTGFTAASGSPYAMDGNDMSVESKSVSSTGVYPATFTPSGSGTDWDTHVLIFKEIVAGSGVSVAWFRA